MLDLVSVGVTLVFAGMAILAVGILLSSGGSEGRVRGGGVVLIGPIPIVFGSDAKWTSVAVVLAIVLVVVVIAVQVMY
jgi:uncharacterized protein (TIGR00304 family)